MTKKQATEKYGKEFVKWCDSLWINYDEVAVKIYTQLGGFQKKASNKENK